MKSFQPTRAIYTNKLPLQSCVVERDKVSENVVDHVRPRRPHAYCDTLRAAIVRLFVVLHLEQHGRGTRASARENTHSAQGGPHDNKEERRDRNVDRRVPEERHHIHQRRRSRGVNVLDNERKPKRKPKQNKTSEHKRHEIVREAVARPRRDHAKRKRQKTDSRRNPHGPVQVWCVDIMQESIIRWSKRRREARDHIARRDIEVLSVVLEGENGAGGRRRDRARKRGVVYRDGLLRNGLESELGVRHRN